MATTDINERCRMEFGCTRAVLLIGRYAVKVPTLRSWKHFLLGLIANMQERVFSAANWPELCPVVWASWGGWLLVMRRAEPITPDQWEAFYPTVKDGWLCGVEGSGYYVPCEPKRNSFGWYGGRIVCLDYGN
jgi:hypothetical protein